MNARIVPFAASSEGGQLKTVGNPAVWWGVFGNFVAVTAVGALWMGRALLGLGAKPAAAAAAPAPAAPAVEPLLAPLLAPSALDARGWAIPWVVLWSGYLLNLVPYMLIARSKFVYHYMPALMVGAALFALSMEALWGWAARAAAPAPRVRAAAAAAVTAAAFAAVTAAFFYFGLPFVYGYKLTHEQHQARMWNSKWQ
jgi:dolichyl-phosphate-mannose--protein O-mannosyl transferase